MFSSSGYFKGVNCPYYASGLCERAYCHFRHVRNEATPKRQAVNANNNVKPLQTLVADAEPQKRNGLGGQSSLLGMVGNAIKQVQRDIEKDKAVIQHLQPNSKAQTKFGIPNYSPTPIDQSLTRNGTQKKQHPSATYLPPGIPAYKPTPIHLLQRKTKSSALEYDPLSNSSLSVRITLADAEQKSGVTQEPNCPEFIPGKAIKKESKELGENEVEAKFSSDEEGLTDNTSNVDTNSSEVTKQTAVKNDTLHNKESDKQSIHKNEDLLVEPAAITKEHIDSLSECGKKSIESLEKGPPQLEAKKQSTDIAHKHSKDMKNSNLIEDEKDVQSERSVNQGQTGLVSEDDHAGSITNSGASKVDNTELMDTCRTETKDTHLDTDEESKSKSKEKNKEQEYSRSTKHKSGRDSSHRHKDGKKKHQHKSSEKAKHRRHESHSSSVKHRHSAGSRHRHTETKSAGHHRSKDDDKHRHKDQSRHHHHKTSSKSYSRSVQNHKKSKSSHKYKKSDRHSHHHHHHQHSHHRKHSSSKSSSSKRRYRHVSVSSNSSYSSSSSSSSSSSFDSSSDWSDSSSSSQSSQQPLSPPSHKHCTNTKVKISNNSSTHNSYLGLKASTLSQKVDSQQKTDKGSDGGKLDGNNASTSDLHDTNLFEKFQRTVSCVDLFGEDSSGSDSGREITDKLQDEDRMITSSAEDDGNDGYCGDNGSSMGDAVANRANDDVQQESKKCQLGIKRKFDDDNHDNMNEAQKTENNSTLAEDNDLLITKRRRLAHVANSDALIKRRALPKAPHRPSPAQVMINRFKELQKAQEAVESEPGPSGCNTAQVTQDVSVLTPKQRTVHTVQGFKEGHTLMRNKPGAAKITMGGISNDTQSQINSTKAGTVAKGASRQAHVPNQKMLKRPIIPAGGGSKVPTNIRQRYLNLFVDECLKIYPQTKDAYDRALLEEKSACARASNKKIYLNVAVNTLKKLRDEVIKSSDSSDQEVKSPTKNPLALSHAAILGGAKAANTKFTVKRSKGRLKLPAHFTSRQLYILLSRYILTEEQLVENSFPRPVPGEPGHAKLQLPDRIKQMSFNSTEKSCARCGKRFFVSVDGVYLTQENCVYHWGKCWKRRIAGSLENRYTCCQGDTESQGCQLSQFHVHEENKYKDLTGYVQTQPVSPPPDGDYKLYAMDCEMVYTRGGCELARVTVIDTNLQSVYEAIVRPEHEVVDYNTRFSGLTADDMKGVNTKLSDVQTELLSLFNDKTILIGHSLESDFIALKLLHNTVVDTSVVFPHKLGPPYKRALRTLMAEILQKIIQNNVDGHDSKEDAAACMELMIWKAKDDAKKALRS